MAGKQTGEDDFPLALRPMRFHGAYKRSGPYILSNEDYVGDCPFCGKSRAFVAHRETGKWVCHSKARICGRNGNAVSFLTQFAEFRAAETTPAQWRELSKRRGGIPSSAYKARGVGYDPKQNRWLVPVWNEEDKLADLRVMNPTGKKMGTAGRKAGCWNLNKVAKVVLESDPKEYTLYIAEGEWDGMPLEWLLEKAGMKNFVVCALPGARTVKDEWADIWKVFGRVIVLGDNDGDGDAMAEKAWGKLYGHVPKIYFVNWPDTWREGYDVSDFIAVNHIKREKPAKRVLRELGKRIGAVHRRMPFKGQEDQEAARGIEREKIERPKTNPTFTETVKVYKKFLRMTDSHILALQFAYSIYLSTQWDDVPLWGFICGSPSSGKTEIVCSMDGCPESLFFSSIEAQQLVSGFRVDPDPSLIPRMIGKCTIVKDWTELLKGNQLALEECNKRLRGWFDGRVDRIFGNGVERIYKGRGNIVAAVTNVIHAANESTVGERFLKFQLPKPPRRESDAISMNALMSTGQESVKNDEIHAASLAFLNRDTPAMIPAESIPEDYRHRIIALANLVAMLRAKVEYVGFGYDKEVSHRPEAELPYRLTKQLAKLSMANCVVLGKKKVDRESFRLTERVAFNTGYGFHLDLIQAIMQAGGLRVRVDDLVDLAKMPESTVRKRLDDLLIMGVLNRATIKLPGPGKNRYIYSVVPSIRRLWDAADVKDNHVKDAAENRRGPKGWNDDE